MLYYLATPYDKYKLGHQAAADEACKQAGLLYSAGIAVFCPIAHSHNVAMSGALSADKVGSHKFWLALDEKFMQFCFGGMILCEMDGWEESKGIAWEAEWFEGQDRDIFRMKPGIVPDGLVKSL